MGDNFFMEGKRVFAHHGTALSPFAPRYNQTNAADALRGFHLVRTQNFRDFRPPPSTLYAFHATYQYCRTQKLVIPLTPPSPLVRTY